MAETIDNKKTGSIEKIEVENAQDVNFENVIKILSGIDLDDNKKIDEQEINGLVDAEFLKEEGNLSKFGEIFDNLNDIDDEMKKELLTSFKSALDNMFNEIIKKDKIIGEDEKKILEFWEKIFGGKRPDDEKKLIEFRENQEKLVEEERENREKVAAEEELLGYTQRFNLLTENEKKDIKKICKEELNDLASYKKGLDVAVSELQGKLEWGDTDIKNANNLNKILGKKESETRAKLENTVQSQLDKVMDDIIKYVGKKGIIPNNKEQGKIIQLGANVLAGEDLVIDGSRGAEQWNFASQTEDEKKTNAYMWKMIIKNRDKIMEKRKEKELLYIPDLDNYLNQIQDEGKREEVWTEFLSFFLAEVNKNGLYFENELHGSKCEELLKMMVRKETGTTVEQEISYLKGLPERTSNQEIILQKLESGTYQDATKLYKVEIDKLKKNIKREEGGYVLEDKRAWDLKGIGELRVKVDNINSEVEKRKFIERINALENSINTTSDQNTLESLKSEIENISNELDNYKTEEEKKIAEESPFDITVDELGAISDTVLRVRASDYDSLYKDEKSRKMVFKLLSYLGFPQSKSDKKGALQLEDLVGQFLAENAGSQQQLQSNPKKMCKFLATKFYNHCLVELENLSFFDKRNFNRKNPKKGKMYACLYGLLDIDGVNDKDVSDKEIYKNVYYRDLDELNYDSLDQFKYKYKKEHNRELGTKEALEELQIKSRENDKTNQNGYETRNIEGYISAPRAYANVSEKEEKYMEFMRSKGNNILSVDEYNRLFHNFYEMQQGYIGDCYFVAALRALVRLPEFPTLIRTSVSCNPNGTYTVTLPLGEPEGIKYIINNQELEKAQIGGSDGYKLLEIAYFKYMDGDKRLSSEKQLERITAGTGRLALKSLLGHEAYEMPYNLKVNGRSERQKNGVINELKNFNPENGDIITITSYSFDNNFEFVDSEGSKQSMSTMHVYCVLSVETDDNGNIIDITLENPHNNGDEQKHFPNVEKFFEFASNIECGHITDKFLNTESSAYIGTQHASLQTAHYAKNIIWCAYDEGGDIISSVKNGNYRTATKQTGKFLYHEAANIGGTIAYAGKTAGLATRESVKYVGEEVREGYKNLVSGTWFDRF